jgi:Leucine-rich repeat (LRR) protein
MNKILDRQIKKGMLLFTALMLSSSWAVANFENIDCIKDQKTLGISTVECKVLEKLWDSTSGKNWQVNQGWDTLSDVGSWEGVVVENSKVSALLLYSAKLEGELPSELGELSSLKRLSFANNNLFGTIPSSLGMLDKLEYLDLSDNHLSGELPETIGRLSSLRELYLNNNELSGNIPDSFGDLKSLHVLKMYENNFSGSIPLTFGGLSSIEILSIAENNLTGTIPSELGSLSTLTFLDLKSNQLTGEIPTQLGNLENLSGLYLQHNNLKGTIPDNLGNLLNLSDLDLSDNKLTGALPSSLGELSILTYLNVSKNELEGDVPVELLNLNRLDYLNLEENKFVSSNLDSIRSELTYIPNVHISSQKIEEDAVVMEPSVIDETEDSEKREPIKIKVLTEEEIALLEMATLKIVGTEEAGDSLFVENEGEWRVEDDSIIFTPLLSFSDLPTPISYTIQDSDGRELAPVEIAIQRSELNMKTITILDANESEGYLIDLLVSEDFIETHSNYILSGDKKELFVDGEGLWRAESNGTITFIADEGFTDKPSNIEYLVFKSTGEKASVGLIDINNKSISEEDREYANSVSLFGLKGLFLMILLGGLYGLFYIREIENKKI